MARAIRYREAYEHRDAFGLWHGEHLPADCKAIDIDLLGYCPRCRKGLYLVEATVNPSKIHTVLSTHCAAARVPGFLVVMDSYAAPEVFRVKQVWPRARWLFDGRWVFSDELEALFLAVRADHTCDGAP